MSGSSWIAFVEHNQSERMKGSMRTNHREEFLWMMLKVHGGCLDDFREI